MYCNLKGVKLIINIDINDVYYKSDDIYDKSVYDVYDV